MRGRLELTASLQWGMAWIPSWNGLLHKSIIQIEFALVGCGSAKLPGPCSNQIGTRVAKREGRRAIETLCDIPLGRWGALGGEQHSGRGEGGAEGCRGGRHISFVLVGSHFLLSSSSRELTLYSCSLPPCAWPCQGQEPRPDHDLDHDRNRSQVQEKGLLARCPRI